MRFNLYGINDVNFYVTCWMANDYKLLSYDTYTKTFSLIMDDKPTKYIEVSEDRAKEFIQKVARKILCTVQ